MSRNTGYLNISNDNNELIIKNKILMSLYGPLDNATLPLSGIGQEITIDEVNVSTFYAMRVVAGISGTTTIQLEINGQPINGATLSWDSNDPNNSIKTIDISEKILDNSTISFKLTSAENGAEHIIAGVV